MKCLQRRAFFCKQELDKRAQESLNVLNKRKRFFSFLNHEVTFFHHSTSSTLFKAVGSYDNTMAYIIKINHHKVYFDYACNEVEVYESFPSILKDLHPCLITSKRVGKDRLIICLEDVGEDLYDFALSGKDTFQFWLKGLIYYKKAIDKLHRNNMYHLDIKLENLTYCMKTDAFKIIDFAFTNLKPKRGGCLGTCPQIAPSLIKNGILSYEDMRCADVYAFCFTWLTLLDLPLEVRCTRCCKSEKKCKFGCLSRLGSDHDQYFAINVEQMYSKAFGGAIFEIPSRWKIPFFDIQICTLCMNLYKILLTQLNPLGKYLILGKENMTVFYTGKNRYYDERNILENIECYWKKICF